MQPEIDLYIAQYYMLSEKSFVEQQRLDLYANYMDVVDKTILTGWIHGVSDDDIFSRIDDITCKMIEPCFAGIDPTQIGATHATD